MFKKLIFDEFKDKRGVLVAIENLKNIPFEIKRVYYMYNIPTLDEIRGEHAHKKLKQVLICISGSCEVTLEDARGKETFALSSPSEGLYMENMTWRTMTKFTKDCVLVSVASELYDRDDYIFEYETFKKNIEENNS